MPRQQTNQRIPQLSHGLPGRDFIRWTVRVSLANKLAFMVLLLAAFSCVASYVGLTKAASPLNKNPTTIYWLLNFNMIILMVLAGMIARRVINLWLRSRQGLAGARLHVQLVRTFSLVAVVPGIVMAIFAAVLFSSIVDQWFGDKVRRAVTDSMAVADAYLIEHQQNIKADELAMAVDLNREASRVLIDPYAMGSLLKTQSLIRNLTESLVFTSRSRILGRSGLTFSMEYEAIPDDVMSRVNNGEVVVVINEKGGQGPRFDEIERLSGCLPLRWPPG